MQRKQRVWRCLLGEGTVSKMRFLVGASHIALQRARHSGLALSRVPVSAWGAEFDDQGLGCPQPPSKRLFLRRRDAVFRCLGHAELDHGLGLDLDRFAGLRIATHACLALSLH